MTDVETPFSLLKTAGILTEAKREELVAAIGADPAFEAVIPDTGGVRKIRWTL